MSLLIVLSNIVCCEIIKDLISRKDESKLRLACKSFRGIKSSPQKFHVCFMRFSERFNIQMTMKDGQRVLLCPGYLYTHSTYDAIRYNSILFVRDFTQELCEVDSERIIISFDTYLHSVSEDILAIVDTTTTKEQRKNSVGGYTLTHTRITITLNPDDIKTQTVDETNIQLPARVPFEPRLIDELYDRLVDYISYPVLAITP